MIQISFHMIGLNFDYHYIMADAATTLDIVFVHLAVSEFTIIGSLRAQYIDTITSLPKDLSPMYVSLLHGVQTLPDCNGVLNHVYAP